MKEMQDFIPFDTARCYDLSLAGVCEYLAFLGAVLGCSLFFKD